jgi:peptidylprolyl isomerase
MSIQQVATPNIQSDEIVCRREFKNGLIIEDLEIGDGEEVVGSDTITMHLKATTAEGREFDNTYKKCLPVTTTLGLGQCILGFEQGIPGMKVGGRRRLIIPSEIGFGDRIVPGVPSSSVLIFELELLDISEW